MNPIESISNTDFIAPSRSGAVLSTDLQAQHVGFGNLVTEGLQAVNQQLISGQTDLQNLALGNVENLHQVMIRLEESKMNFQLMMQVRNRLLEAYQDVMKMSV